MGLHRSTRAVAGATALLLTAVMAACGGGGGGGESGDRDDGHDHSHGHHDAAAGAAATAAEDRCDRGVNTPEFNETTTLVAEHHEHTAGEQVDFTLGDWVDAFVDEEVSGVTVDEVMEYYEADPRRGEQILQGESTPRIGPDDWVPTTDAAGCATLVGQVQAARDAAARYPTVADARAAGYTPDSFYAPGGGAHYVNTSLIGGDFDPAAPELLMFDGHEPDSHIVGVMYYLFAPDGLPDGDPGFVGPNDHWHAHARGCRNAAGKTVPMTECDAGRGTATDTSAGFMAHAWVVPGCESDWGVFSVANPRLPILTGRDPDIPGTAAGPPSPFAVGCNSGTTVTDPLGADDAGDGPTVT